jgi:hypothetical protein
MHHVRTGAEYAPHQYQYTDLSIRAKQVMVLHPGKTSQTRMGIKSISMESIANTQKVEKFPVRLHSFLELASNDAVLSSIVSWLPDGKSFTVHDQSSFAELVLPVHFGGMNSHKSFRRQLNLYGITKNVQDQHERNSTGKQATQESSEQYHAVRTIRRILM